VFQMADDKAKDDEQAASGGSKKKLIIIIVAAVVLVGIIAGAALFFLGGDKAADPGTEAAVKVDRADALYVDLKPAFTVNLSPEDPVGFLQVSIQVLTFDSQVAAELEKHKPLIRNNLVLLFGEQKSVDLRTPDGKTKLQKATLDMIQGVIKKYGSGGRVENIFFTNFVMQ